MKFETISKNSKIFLENYLYVNSHRPSLSVTAPQVLRARKIPENGSAGNLSRVWRKNTNCLEIWRNFRKFSKEFQRKIEFLRVLESLLVKIEPSKITSFFYKNFLNIEVGDVPYASPWRRLCLLHFTFFTGTFILKYSKNRLLYLPAGLSTALK